MFFQRKNYFKGDKQRSVTKHEKPIEINLAIEYIITYNYRHTKI